MTFNFKRELGVSDLIAVAALCVSIVALWQTSVADDPYLLVGSGPTMTGIIHDSEKEVCEFVAQIPVEINNSGKKSIIFKQLLPDEDRPPVMFSSDRKFLDRGGIPHQIFLSQFEMRSPSELVISKNTALKLDVAAARHIGILIKPGESFKRWLVVESDVRDAMNNVPDTLYFAVQFKFSDGQSHSLRQALHLPSLKQGCAHGS